jgi:leader peptidase (prepilin peptidase)/N-methyltransferase
MTDMASVLANNAGWLMVVVLLFGLLVGSFLNVVIHRLPIMMERGWQRECDAYLGRELTAERYNLVVPASHCPACKTEVKPWQNIPLLSYALLRGRCQHCGANQYALPLGGTAYRSAVCPAGLALWLERAIGWAIWP